MFGKNEKVGRTPLFCLTGVPLRITIPKDRKDGPGVRLQGMNFLSTLISVVVLVVVAVPGFLLRKTHILPSGSASVLAALLLFVAQPFLMISSVLNKPFEVSMLDEFGWIALFAIVLQLAVYLIARLVFSGCKEEATRRACVACSYLGNVGFMGIPVMQMLFPGNSDLILYTVIYNIVFNAMAWTLGVYAVTGDRRKVRPLKILLNPPTIAVLVALPFFFCNVTIPEDVLTPIGYLGDMTLPLSMLILGIRLADMPVRAMFCNLRVYVVAAVKLVVCPLLSFGVLMLVGLLVPVSPYVIIALFVIAAMPSASSALNFAEMYGGDCETAAAATLTNTLLCVLTIPVLMLLCTFVV